jgi:hypothetical protein
MVTLPIPTQQWAARHRFSWFLLASGSPLLAFKSHAEWDEKTTQAGANQEKVCFD